jgi:hypothetical protein
VRILQVDAPKGGTAPNTDQQGPSRGGGY